MSDEEEIRIAFRGWQPTILGIPIGRTRWQATCKNCGWTSEWMRHENHAILIARAHIGHWHKDHELL